MTTSWFTLEVSHRGAWVAIVGDNSRRFVEGYEARYRESRPRPAYRLMRWTGGRPRLLGYVGGEGKVLREEGPIDTLNIGMVAGWPTTAQLVGASAKALHEAVTLHICRRHGQGDGDASAADIQRIKEALTLLRQVGAGHAE